MDEIGYAVVGQGYFAQEKVLPAFAHARKNSRLVALLSDDPVKQKRLSRRYGAEHALGYDQYDDFLRSGAVDAVYIALPNHLHCEYTERAAAAGVHVLCEKPMALDSAECRRMIRACERAGTKLMIAYRLHFEEANMLAAELAQSGKLGRLRLFASSFSYQVKADNIRTSSEKGGGPLYDLGTYCVNAARYVYIPLSWKLTIDDQERQKQLRAVRLSDHERRRRPDTGQVRTRPNVKKPPLVNAEEPVRE